MEKRRFTVTFDDSAADAMFGLAYRHINITDRMVDNEPTGSRHFDTLAEEVQMNLPSMEVSPLVIDTLFNMKAFIALCVAQEKFFNDFLSEPGNLLIVRRADGSEAAVEIR